MDLALYVDRIRRDLSASAASAGPDVAEAGTRLVAALDATVRLALLDALTDAAAAITAEMDDGAVEVRLRAGDPEFVVTPPAPPSVGPLPPPPGPVGDVEGDDGPAAARITLRLPESLKQRAEHAAEQARQSLNTWLVDAIRDATTAPEAARRGRRGRSGQHVSGWAR